ncbi:hypothetical protein [Planctomicrobium piriforme]|uniref:Uncharacterized protein n=1 Tax=Planctomicrobium piriforme TaxID=1576369 RepID=A0A1I3C3S5_9PLAN|nr:hypothetical protein [Planctomicrobium piriforme]SFH69187.1 hypothetical protein SAMN05421753_10287 [Planctomicrobium piriforme]
MRRFGQQTWFCVAAACLAGTLTMYWSQDIDVAPSDLSHVGEQASGHGIVRRWQDLPPSAPPEFTRSETAPQTLQKSLAPPAALRPGVTKLSDSPRDSGIQRAGYQQSTPPVVPPAVWLDGRIEATP